MRRLRTRQPLLHFLVIGALLFAVDLLRRPPADPGRIELSAARVEAERQSWEVQAGRALSEAEEEALLRQLAREEMLYREALALGLDRQDPVVRRRLVRKMEMLVEDSLPVAEPNEAALEDFLEAHPERYARGPRLALEHRFFSPDTRQDAASDAEQAMRSLREDPEAAVEADPFALGSRLGPWEASRMADRMGEGFAEAVSGLEPGRWAGPISSSYGLHLVRVELAEPGGLPPLHEIEAELRRDWEAAQRGEALEARFEEMAADYEVVVP